MSVNAPFWLSSILPARPLLIVRRMLYLDTIDAKPKLVLYRLLPPLTIMLILLVGGGWTLLYYQHREMLTERMTSEISDVAGDLHVSLSQQASGLAAAILPIASDHNVQQALREGNVERLFADWRGLFEILRREHQVTHFKFFDTNRVCILRLHRPDVHGDRDDRFTTLEAERTGRTSSGIELGQLGNPNEKVTFTLRVVQPVFADGVLVGYVMLGKEIEDVLRSLHTLAGVQLSMVIHKDQIDRQTWEMGMRRLGRDANWDRLKNHAVVYSSLNNLPDAFSTNLECNYENKNAFDEIQFDAKTWLISKTPMQDASGQVVGDLLIMDDITTNKANFKRLLIAGTGISLLLLGLLLGFTDILLRRTDASIHAQQETLQKSEEYLAATLRSIGDGVITVDTSGKVTNLNNVAQALTGWNIEEAYGRPIAEIFRIIHTQTRQAAEIPVGRVLLEDCVLGLPSDTTVIARDGTERQIADRCTPIHDTKGTVIGAVLVFSDVTDEYRKNEQLHESEKRFLDVLYASNDAILLIDGEKFVDCNEATVKMLGYHDKHECLMTHPSQLSPPVQPDGRNSGEKANEMMTTALDRGFHRFEWTHRKANGEDFPVEVSLTAIVIGGKTQLHCVWRDITQIKLAEQQLHESNMHLSQLNHELESTAAQIKSLMTEVVTKNDFSVRYTNASLQPCWQEKQCKQTSCPCYGNLENRRCWEVAGTSCGGKAQGKFAQKLGNCSLCSVYQHARSTPVMDLGETFNDMIAILRDRHNELHHSSFHDKLTGLPNRALLGDRLQQAVLRAKRLKGYKFAVLFLDFDRFKTINDSLGHDVGDMLLKEIAQRLNNTVRAGDSVGRNATESTTARLGGDEFVVLLDSISNPDDATLVANRLLEVLSKPYQLGKHEVYSTASIGIVTSDLALDNADDILRDADTAMYEAKLAGKGRYVAFNVSMRQRVQNRLNLETDLRRALDTTQLFLMYQPIISLQSGKIESFEALLRWKHPQRGLIAPGEFIPIAEDTGLIIPLGEWVLRTACTEFVHWQQSLGDAASPSISVNLSRNQLLLPNLTRTLQEILDQTNIASSCLHLEVTESAVMKDVTTTTRMLHAIKAMGVKLDMDDFGTGYSSLSCLHQFPIDVLKIDRSFIANINRGRNYAALVHAVSQLARNLNISVVAEGVETLDQALVLQSLECEFGQGYLFGKPLLAEHVLQFQVQPGVLPGISANQNAWTPGSVKIQNESTCL